MKPAPPFDCAVCERHIGKTATHYLLADALNPLNQLVVCARCYLMTHDTLLSHGTRAGIAAVLGLWP